MRSALEEAFGEEYDGCPSEGRRAVERVGDEVHLSECEACGGEQPHIVRWVLGISLVLAVGLLSAVWIIASLI